LIKTNFDLFPNLAAKQVSLRKISHADEAEVFFLRSDKGVMRYTGQALATTRDEIVLYIDKHLETIKKGTGLTWAITLKDDPTLIGIIAFRKFYKEHYRGEIGYGLHPQYHGKGLMQEAIAAIIDFGFNEIGLHSIEANVDKDNVASIKLLERNKFVKEAHYKENYFFEGKFIDSVIYSLINCKQPDNAGVQF
jgi:ribosomal-protein-alanine N-acetyltransferase